MASRYSPYILDFIKTAPFAKLLLEWLPDSVTGLDMAYKAEHKGQVSWINMNKLDDKQKYILENQSHMAYNPEYRKSLPTTCSKIGKLFAKSAFIKRVETASESAQRSVGCSIGAEDFFVTPGWQAKILTIASNEWSAFQEAQQTTDSNYVYSIEEKVNAVYNKEHDTTENKEDTARDHNVSDLSRSCMRYQESTKFYDHVGAKIAVLRHKDRLHSVLARTLVWGDCKLIPYSDEDTYVEETATCYDRVYAVSAKHCLNLQRFLDAKGFKNISQLRSDRKHRIIFTTAKPCEDYEDTRLLPYLDNMNTVYSKMLATRPVPNPERQTDYGGCKGSDVYTPWGDLDDDDCDDDDDDDNARECGNCGESFDLGDMRWSDYHDCYLCEDHQAQSNMYNDVLDIDRAVYCEELDDYYPDNENTAFSKVLEEHLPISRVRFGTVVSPNGLNGYKILRNTCVPDTWNPTITFVNEENMTHDVYFLGIGNCSHEITNEGTPLLALEGRYQLRDKVILGALHPLRVSLPANPTEIAGLQNATTNYPWLRGSREISCSAPAYLTREHKDLNWSLLNTFLISVKDGVPTVGIEVTTHNIEDDIEVLTTEEAAETGYNRFFAFEPLKGEYDNVHV